MNAIYRIRLLGPVEVETAETPVSGFVSRKAVALLGYLAVQDRPLARSYLADLFWGDKTEAQGRNNLSRALNNLTTLLPGCWQADYYTVRFLLTSDYWLDSHAFAKFCTQADPASLTEAVDLYRGDFMSGLYLDDCPEFETWLVVEQARWRQQAFQTLRRLINHYTYHRNYDQALSLAARFLALAPWEEEAHRLLMLLLARSGQRSAALAQYDACRRLLQEEVGVEPAAETVAIYKRILAMAATAPRHNLLAQPTPFVGRAEELGQIAKLLHDPTCRLLTLMGPGGIGKTRLAFEVAAQIAADKILHFLHGVYFVPLAAVTSADLLAATIADALQLSFYGAADPKTHLVNHLRDKEMLLILDNFEQLLAGTNLVVDMLQNAPALKIIATSRTRLDVRWEWLFDLQGLDLPEPPPSLPPHRGRVWEGVERFSAVQLFLQTARRVQPSFTLTEAVKPAMVRICQLVEGLPLGLELAAAWVRQHACEAIVQEIERTLDFLATSMQDVPPRHRSLRAVFDYSWEFLSATERQVFSQLAVFRGGFRPEAAAQVADASPAILTSLANKSFLRRDATGRYDMHELLRQYGLEKLKEVAGAYEETQDRHCTYYAEFLAQRVISQGGNQQEMLSEISVENNNVRASWRWAVEWRKLVEISKLTESLFNFHELRGLFQEGETIFAWAAVELAAGKMMATSPDQFTFSAEEGQVVGQILARQAWFSFRLGLNNKAMKLLEQAQIILQDVGHDTQPKSGFFLYLRGMAAWHMGEYREAQQFLYESLAVGREVNDLFITAASFVHLGLTAQALGEYAEAQLLHQEGLKIFQEMNERRGILIELACLGNIAYTLGEYIQAEKLLRESLAIGLMGDPFGTGFSLYHLGVLAFLKNEYKEARQWFQESLKIVEEAAEYWVLVHVLVYLGHTACAVEDYQEAKKHFFQALSISTKGQIIPTTLAALVGIAILFTREGQKGQALELLSFVMRHPASEQETKDRAKYLLTDLENQLPPQALARAKKRVQTRKLDNVVAEILQNR